MSRHNHPVPHIPRPSSSSPSTALHHWPQFAKGPVGLSVLVLTALILSGCDRAGEIPATSSTAEADFGTLVAACTQFLAAREPHVRPGGSGEWTKTGHSPALVQREINRTESPVTPYVGKIVIKDNEAQATATTEAAAQTITLTPAHLLSNRTHTFIYSFDGKLWRWQNGQRLTKIPGQNDSTVALTLADVDAAGPKGFAGCVPR